VGMQQRKSLIFLWSLKFANPKYFHTRLESDIRKTSNRDSK